MIGVHSGNSAPSSDIDTVSSFVTFLPSSLPEVPATPACQVQVMPATAACNFCLLAQPAITNFFHYTAYNTACKCALQQLAFRLCGWPAAFRCSLSLQPVTAACQCCLPMLPAAAAYHSCLSLQPPLLPVTAECHSCLPRCLSLPPATAACHCSLPLLPATAACHCCLLLPVHCYQALLPLPSNWLLVTAGWLPQTTMAFANHSTI
jgi:hypothetical protein